MKFSKVKEYHKRSASRIKRFRRHANRTKYRKSKRGKRWIHELSKLEKSTNKDDIPQKDDNDDKIDKNDQSNKGINNIENDQKEDINNDSSSLDTSKSDSDTAELNTSWNIPLPTAPNPSTHQTKSQSSSTREINNIDSYLYNINMITLATPPPTNNTPTNNNSTNNNPTITMDSNVTTSELTNSQQETTQQQNAQSQQSNSNNNRQYNNEVPPEYYRDIVNSPTEIDVGTPPKRIPDSIDWTQFPEDSIDWTKYENTLTQNAQQSPRSLSLTIKLERYSQQPPNANQKPIDQPTQFEKEKSKSRSIKQEFKEDDTVLTQGQFHTSRITPPLTDVEIKEMAIDNASNGQPHDDINDYLDNIPNNVYVPFDQQLKTPPPPELHYMKQRTTYDYYYARRKANYGLYHEEKDSQMFKEDIQDHEYAMIHLAQYQHILDNPTIKDRMMKLQQQRRFLHHVKTRLTKETNKRNVKKIRKTK